MFERKDILLFLLSNFNHYTIYRKLFQGETIKYIIYIGTKAKDLPVHSQMKIIATARIHFLLATITFAFPCISIYL